MGRINVNQVINESSKIEELPSRIGLRKDVKAQISDPFQDNIKIYRHGNQYYDIVSRIFRGSLGKNWNEIVKKIREKLPPGFEQKHPWITERPDIMIQDSVDGKWYWQDAKGHIGLTGYDTPTELKHASIRRYARGGGNFYYLDIQGRLKALPKKKFRRYPQPSKVEKQQDRSYGNLIDFVKTKADYYKKIGKSSFNDEYRSIFMDVPTTKKILQYDEFGDIVEVEVPTTTSVYFNVKEFINWCEVNKKTYFIQGEGEYFTNLKLTYKQ